MVKRQGWSEERIFERFPWIRGIMNGGGDVWDGLFDARPDMVHLILSDVIKQAYAVPGKVGQRPMPREEDISSDLDWIFESEPNRKPMREILPDLMGCSERGFCEKIGMSRRMFQRMMAGEYELDIDQLRRIAAAVEKPPAFFIEYRRRMLFSALANVLLQEPGTADWLYGSFIKTAREVKKKGPSAAKPMGPRRMRDGVQAIYSLAEQFNLSVQLAPKPETDHRRTRKHT